MKYKQKPIIFTNDRELQIKMSSDSKIDGDDCKNTEQSNDDTIISELLSPAQALPSLDDDIAAQYLENDLNVINKFRGCYLEQNADSVNQLSPALENFELQPLKQIAHRMKSSSQFIGAMKLQYYCASLEKEAANVQADKVIITTLTNALIQEFNGLTQLISAANAAANNN